MEPVRTFARQGIRLCAQIVHVNEYEYMRSLALFLPRWEDGIKIRANRGRSSSGTEIQALRGEALAISNCAVGLAIVRRPLHEVGIEEAIAAMLGIDLKQHIRIRIVTRGRHDVVLRSVGMGEIDPLVHMP